MEPCIKVLGADFELANALEIGNHRQGNVSEAARRLLDEIPGYPRKRYWAGGPMEWGRRFLPTSGASAYIDSDHLEINLPEHTRAADHAAMVHAGLQLARQAQVAASRKLCEGGRINVMASVSDGLQSWGHHLNVMIRRELFDGMFGRKPHLAGFVATHLATATLYTGQGQVGAGNQCEACDYQLSQRADWFEELFGQQTTHRRPLLNMRDEAHAGADFARLHLIFFDRVLCPIANYLMAGATQLVLAMAEAGWADPTLLLDDPLASAHDVSRDLSLRQPLPLAGRGRAMTAIEVQQALADLAGEFVASGEAGQSVHGAEAIIACWKETLEMLAKRDLGAAARRCDWALKYLLLERQRGRKGLSWQSPEMKCLDLLYASLDPREGFFRQMAAAGQVEAMPSAEQVQRFLDEPPDDSRAYLRAHLLRRFGDQVTDMDWEWMEFRTQGNSFWSSRSVLVMPDPTKFGKEASDAILDRCQTLQEVIDAVGAAAPAPAWGNESPWWQRGWGQQRPDTGGSRLPYYRS